MEMKTAISCTILRHTKILIAVGVLIISLATLGSKNHTTNITKIVTQSIGIIIKRRSEERFSRNAETDLVCRLLLEKKKRRTLERQTPQAGSGALRQARAPDQRRRHCHHQHP